jgi:bifunctional non-homologous end joining protein LigD
LDVVGFDDLSPMLLSAASEPPSNESAWAYELKWDGMRALVWAGDGKLVVRSRRGNDYTEAFPELAGLSRDDRPD